MVLQTFAAPGNLSNFNIIVEIIMIIVLNNYFILPRDNKKTHIVLRHIQLAVRNGEKLSKLFGDIMIANGGVMPNIHNLLLPKNKNAPKPSVLFLSHALQMRYRDS
ncbi:hypothetical protein RJ639_024542 [Escallonia herrerae]|uniref:Histone H2A C-terminal domain-containing protein n=1 Tax=Escallonia herrerae TaxID=1293975 RepID=A0AA89AF29_9ASTE|nr:hypothetical protein RJ639_024542 [Escallonia herrerae]